MPIPKKIRIGSQVFDIVERARTNDGMLNDSTMGYTLDVENLIVVDVTLALSRKKQVIVHELLHAMRMIFDTSVQPKKDSTFETWEHYFIGIWEEPLLMLLRDNPKLIEWLVEDNG